MYVHSLPSLLIIYFSIILMHKSLVQLLERHFGAALSEVGRQQLDVAKQHAATVTATLNAINAYAEWAPLPDLAKYGIIHGYDNLVLRDSDFNSLVWIGFYTSLSLLLYFIPVVVSYFLLPTFVFMLVSFSNLSRQGIFRTLMQLIIFLLPDRAFL